MTSALSLAQRGLYVFPLSPQSKKPFKDSVGLLDATTDSEKITAWWTRQPRANIGIALGRSNLAAIDIDPRHGGDETFVALEEELGRLPDCPTALTPSGGRHLYLKQPVNRRMQSRQPAFGPDYPGVDIKSDGGYVVAAPSIHPNGGRYMWEVRGEKVEIPEIPDAWVKKYATLDKSPIHGVDNDMPILFGAQHTTLVRLAGRLRGEGMTPDAIADCLIAVGKRQCVPQVEEGKAREIAMSTANWAPRANGVLSKNGTIVSPMNAFEILKQIEAFKDTDMRRYVTGLDNVDRVLGHMLPGELTVIGARPGQGKTSMAEQIALRNSCEYRVFFATLEMTPEQIVNRFVGDLMRMTADDVALHRKNQTQEYNVAREDLEQRTLNLWRPRSDQHKTVNATLEAAAADRADLLIIDYTREFDDWIPGDTRADSLLVKKIHQFCQDTHIHAVLLSQLNRDAQNKRPTMAQFQDTSQLETTGEKVIMLYRPFTGEPGEDHICEFIVGKNRGGGPECRTHLRWIGPTTAYFPMTREESNHAKCCEKKQRQAVA